MNELAVILLIFLAGFLLGLFFFGVLWWTTKRGLRSKSPALWFLGSLFIRMSIIITVFYLISRNHWERALICLIGFIIARMIVMRYTQTPDLNQNHLKKENDNEN
jgi:F1F0 ATPase subunit 2